MRECKIEYLANTNSYLKKKGSSNCFKIMNEKFININKNKFKLIYNNKKLKKNELFKYQKEGQKIKIKIKIVGIYNISNISYMFDGCDTLELFSCCHDDYQINELSKDENYECLDGANINNNKKFILDEKKIIFYQLIRINIYHI